MLHAAIGKKVIAIWGWSKRYY